MPPRFRPRRNLPPEIDPVDLHVGARIALRRRMLVLTQKQLAAALGTSQSHLHRYEQGHVRVAASVLHRIAARLRVPVSFFFAGLPDGSDAVADDLVLRYDQIAPELRHSLDAIIRALASAGQ